MKFDISKRTFFLIAGGVILLDHIMKRVIMTVLRLNEGLIPGNGFFNIIRTHNTGAGFGILQDQTQLLSVVSIIVAGLIVYYFKKIKSYDRIFFAIIQVNFRYFSANARYDSLLS